MRVVEPLNGRTFVTVPSFPIVARMRTTLVELPGAGGGEIFAAGSPMVRCSSLCFHSGPGSGNTKKYWRKRISTFGESNTVWSGNSTIRAALPSAGAVTGKNDAGDEEEAGSGGAEKFGSGATAVLSGRCTASPAAAALELGLVKPSTLAAARLGAIRMSAGAGFPA